MEYGGWATNYSTIYMASQSLIAVRTTVGDYESQCMSTSVDFYNKVICALLHVDRTLHCMVVLRHVHGYTLAPSYNFIGQQTKNICEVMSEICKFSYSHLLNFPDLYIK